MKRKSMGFKTEFLVKENPDEKIEIDYIQERIKISGNDYLDLHTITDLQKFQVGYSKVVKHRLFKSDEYSSPKFFNVMAIRNKMRYSDYWFFLCDSKKRFCHLAKEFMEAYDLEATVIVERITPIHISREKGTKYEFGRKGYNAKRFFKEAVDVYDARREFLKFLLYVGKTERRNSADDIFSDQWRKINDVVDILDCRVTNCKFDLPDDFDDNFVSNKEYCLIIDKSEFDTLFEGISRLLPENKKVTQIENEYGKNFMKKEEVLERYRQSVSTEDFSSQKREIQKEIEYCTEQIEKKTIDKDFGEKYIAILNEKMKILKDQSYMEARKKGEIGEKEVDYALKWLDKSYVIVPKMLSKRHGIETIELYNPEFINESQEYDHIVIGKQGVFVIETKYYSGTLIIDANGNWIRTKKDGTHVGERNPYQQVDRHIKLLKSFLNKDIPVTGLICIAHSEAIIEGAENSPIQLVKSDLLVKYIEDYSLNSKVLSDDEIKECLSLIEDHRYK